MATNTRPWRGGEPSGHGAEALGLLGSIPLPALQCILSWLGWKDQARCQIVCRQLETSLGQLVTELILRLTRNLDHQFFREFNQLHRVTITQCSDDPAQERVADLLEFLITQPTLKFLKVELKKPKPSATTAAVLALLPRCQGLEVLDLTIQLDDVNEARELHGMADAVRLSRFPSLKELSLGGRAFLTPSGETWLGLLSIWDQDPEAFRQLQTLKLDMGPLRRPISGQAEADLARMGQRLGEVHHKQLRSLTIGASWERGPALLAFIAGACGHSAQPVELSVMELGGRSFYGGKLAEHLGGLLSAAAPGGGVSIVKLSFNGPCGRHVLTQGMRSGGLAGLRVLEVIASHDEELPDILGVLECLSSTPLVCPELAVLHLDVKCTYEPVPPRLMDALRTATGAPGRKLESITFEAHLISPRAAEAFCRRSLRYSHLTFFRMSWMTPVVAATVINVLRTACHQPKNVTFLSMCGHEQSRSSYMSVLFWHLVPRPDEVAFTKSHGRAAGLKEFKIVEVDSVTCTCESISEFGTPVWITHSTAR